MPDGDIVYFGVSPSYAKAYKALCQSYFTPEQVAKITAKAMRKGLNRYGNPPLSLITQTFSGIADAIATGTPIHPAEESYMIDDMARTLQGHRRGIPLAVDTCKAYVMKVCQDDADPSSIKTSIREYIQRVLDADFIECLPLLKHHNDVDPEFVEQRLEQVRPYLALEVERIVAQLAKNPDVTALRKARRASTEPEPDFAIMDISMLGSAPNDDAFKA